MNELHCLDNTATPSFIPFISVGQNVAANYNHYFFKDVMVKNGDQYFFNEVTAIQINNHQ
jgi:hypothetical protein